MRIFVSILLLCCSLVCGAQTAADSLAVDTLDLRTIVLAEEEERGPFFCGVGVSVDLAGLVMLGVANYGSVEGALRLNFRNRWFPVVELGVGSSDHENENTELRFKTSSPYGRVGVDYNFARDLTTGNRVYGGVRLAYCSMKFDLTGPAIEDVFYGGETEYSFYDLESSTTWLEFLFGLEAKIWRWFHLGWNVRYKRRLSQDSPELGKPWYVAGYGKNGGATFGAQFNIVVDI